MSSQGQGKGPGVPGAGAAPADPPCSPQTISCAVCALLLSRCLGPAALVSTPSPLPAPSAPLWGPSWGGDTRRGHPALPLLSLLQKWALLALSACSSLCCLCCLLGLLVAIGLTLGNQGRVLLAPCSTSSAALAPVSPECPFDPTRVYSCTLSLWAISLLLEAMGIFFSSRCLRLTLELLRPGRCCRGVLRMKLSLQAAPVESPGPGQCLGLLRLDSGESARL
ncbi:transmembrane protein 54 [Passer montanus]|uniref:transmembrane protein 54 n=1 Tax=Passer montanus TaxID=9160 RepID=UPI00195F26D7|nr:transmembrane protein 54 [Passer montanus]